MNKDREDKMGELKQQIEAGEYRVDPTAVADAIVRRLREPATGHSPAVRRSDRPSAAAATVRTRARTRRAPRSRR